MSRYHGNGEKCPHCGITYGEFRTGMRYADVFTMFWSCDEDPSTWRQKRRRTILGKWHQIKKGFWDLHTKECLEMGLPAKSYADPPAFDIGELSFNDPQAGLDFDPQTGLDLNDVPF